MAKKSKKLDMRAWPKPSPAKESSPVQPGVGPTAPHFPLMKESEVYNFDNAPEKIMITLNGEEKIIDKAKIFEALKSVAPKTQVKPPAPRPMPPSGIRINTAKFTRPGGYHKLRYSLTYIEKKLNKGKPLDQTRLVAALKAFDDSLGERMKDFVSALFTRFEKNPEITDEAREAMRDFRKIHILGGK